MKSPFVSRWAFETMELARNAEHENAQFLRRQLADAQSRYDALLEKYHERTSNPLGMASLAPVDPLGPKARAAVNMIGKGLSRDVRESMEARAVDMAKQGVDDGHVADAIRRGEPLRIA